jgi:hypothetical protein
MNSTHVVCNVCGDWNMVESAFLDVTESIRGSTRGVSPEQRVHVCPRCLGKLAAFVTRADGAEPVKQERIELGNCVHCNMWTIEPRSETCACGEELYPTARVAKPGARIKRCGGDDEYIPAPEDYPNWAAEKKHFMERKRRALGELGVRQGGRK